MKKPNAVLHMIAYGVLYGWLMSYTLGFILLGSLAESPSEYRSGLVSLAWGAFIIGALLGGAVGFVEGCILWFLTRHIAPPLQQNEYIHIRNRLFGIFGVVTFLGLASLLWFIFLVWLQVTYFFWIYGLILGLIVWGVTMYHYMLKLRAWANVGKAKNE